MKETLNVIAKLIRQRDYERLDTECIYMTKKRLSEIVNYFSGFLKCTDVIIEKNHVVNFTYLGKEIEIIDEDTIIVGGFYIGSEKND